MWPSSLISRSASSETVWNGTLRRPSDPSRKTATTGLERSFCHSEVPFFRSMVTVIPDELLVRWRNSADIRRKMINTWLSKYDGRVNRKEIDINGTEWNECFSLSSADLPTLCKEQTVVRIDSMCKSLIVRNVPHVWLHGRSISCKIETGFYGFDAKDFIFFDKFMRDKCFINKANWSNAFSLVLLIKAFVNY